VSEAAAARWVARAWMLLIVSSALYFLADNEADNDLWVHLFSGRLILAAGAVPRVDTLSYTAAGLPWVDHEWLVQALFAALYALLGSPGLWLCKLAIALCTAWIIWRSVAARSASWWVRGPLLVLVFATLARGYAIRPQIVTYFAVALLLSCLDRLDEARRRPALWSVLGLTAIGFAIWANAHGGFVVGIGILGLFALVPRWSIGSSQSASPPLPAGTSPATTSGVRVLMLAVAFVAACLNPYGPALYGYIGGEIWAPHPLTEWQPMHAADPSHLPFLLLLAAWIVTLPFAASLRRRPWRTVLVAIVAVMALRQQRHSPLLALCAAAPLAEQGDAALAWLRDKLSLRLSAAASAAIAIGVAALALGQMARLAEHVWLAGGGVVYAADEYPVGALRFLHESGAPGNLALPLDWGGYALWHTAPAVRVSLDGRFATVYPPRVVEDNFALFRGDADASARRMLDAYDTNLVLVPRGMATPIDAQPGWQRLYADDVATLFGRSGAPATAAGETLRGWLAFP
jgi:hypothetical protein